MSAPRERTLRHEIWTVAERWRMQYLIDDEWQYVMGGSSENIYNRLFALDLETASPEDVAKIIGNTSWASLRCDGCKEEVPRAIEVGEDSDYESHTATLCTTCLAEAALALADDDATETTGKILDLMAALREALGNQ